MAKRVLITGGIGTGKSSCAKIFELLGVPLFNDDLVGRDVTNSDIEVKNAISKLFGLGVYGEDGLNRKKVASIVFNDQAKLLALSAIIHPAVQSRYVQWCRKNNHYPYIVRESALANNEDGLFNFVIVVDAPMDLRIERVKRRDKCSSEEVIRRINNQISQEERLKSANFIVLCNNQEFVIPQILVIHNTLLKP